jgi:hypothetical protein
MGLRVNGSRRRLGLGWVDDISFSRVVRQRPHDPPYANSEVLLEGVEIKWFDPCIS